MQEKEREGEWKRRSKEKRLSISLVEEMAAERLAEVVPRQWPLYGAREPSLGTVLAARGSFASPSLENKKKKKTRTLRGRRKKIFKKIV